MKVDCAIIRRLSGLRLPIWLKATVMLAWLFAAALPGAKLSDDLQKVSPGVSLDVIVQFTGPPSQADINSITNSGGNLKRSLPNINGALIRLPRTALDGIARNPRVLYISPDRKLSGKLEYAKASTGASLAYSYGWTGSGI